MRYMVLESGNRPPQQVGRREARRRADFLKLFSDESKTVPPIVGVAIGADSDNTQSKSVAYVSGVALE